MIDEPSFEAASDDLKVVLRSAVRLQELVPDAVLVGGSAAALYAGHRDSFDHDHVVADLRERFELILEAIESEGEWVTNRVIPGKLILGRLGEIEAGVRQMIRRRPLETVDIKIEGHGRLRVPTAEETLRIKAFLIVRRNQTRDYLDTAALADRHGVSASARILAAIDDYYADQNVDGPRGPQEGVASQLVRQLADPRPADPSVTKELDSYRNLSGEWAHWTHVREVCAQLAGEILEAGTEGV